jgi:hypothetical protein
MAKASSTRPTRAAAHGPRSIETARRARGQASTPAAIADPRTNAPQPSRTMRSVAIASKTTPAAAVSAAASPAAPAARGEPPTAKSARTEASAIAIVARRVDQGSANARAGTTSIQSIATPSGRGLADAEWIPIASGARPSRGGSANSITR